MAFLQQVPLKYKFWAVNSVAFVSTLILVLVALWVEQQSLHQERTRLAGELILSLGEDVSIKGLQLLPGSTRLAGTEGSRTPQPIWVPDSELQVSQQDTLHGLWVVKQGEQTRILGVERVAFMTLLFERAPLYALAVFILMSAVLVVSQLLIVFITRHIVVLRDVMLKVQKTGDLTLLANVDSSDESRSIGGAFNTMQSAQQQIVSSVRAAAGQLDQGAGELAGLMNQVRDGMISQQGQTDMVAAAVNQMGATVQDISAATMVTRDQSHQADQLAREGRDQVGRVSQTIAGLASSIKRCTEHMQKLQGHSHEISGVVNVIRSIAEQTNLLALNAAIEAARAGESGRGFAVVADEVRALAQRVQSSTDEIQRMIEALQGGTDDAVKDMQASSSLTLESVAQSDQAGQSLGVITAAVSQIRDGNSEIASAIEQQSQAADAITENIVQIRDVTEKTVEKTLLSASTSEQLAALAHQLSNAVSRLKS